MSGDDVGALIGSASKVDPTIKASLSAQAESYAKKGLKFFAVGPGDEANVNIGIFDTALPIAQLQVQVKLALGSIGGKNIHIKKTHFSFGSAVTGTYTVPLATGSSVYGTQVYASHGGRTYIVTFSGGKKSVEAAASVSMMRTWQFT